MINSKLPRRKALLFILAGTSCLVASFPTYAEKKKRSRSDRRYYRDKSYRDRDDDSPNPSPTPVPTPAQPEKYSPPHPALIPSVAGGLFGLFGLIGGWFWKISNSSAPTSPSKARSSNLPPPDPVEQELNQLKAQSGMSRMKTARQPVAPIPETAEWYVFRSGNAEGPYTKMHLLEIQKITDRTKVRRGETQWQRAGEIPELAAYLTQQ